MGLCADAPDYPTAQMEQQIELSRELGNRYLELSEQQQGWAEDQWDQTYSLLQDTLGTQTSISKEQWENAKKDRARYEEKFQPLEDNLIQEFRDYDSPERRALESGRAQAGVQQAFDAQRRNAEKRLEGYGIDPSETRGQAIDAEARINAAAQMAGQGNQARKQVEQTGRALRADAINIGKGLPSQVAQSYGQAIQAGNSAMGNQTGAVASGANTMGTGSQFLSGAGGMNAQTMGGINNMYSGQLTGFNAQGTPMGLLGDVAGTALGAYVGGGGTFGGGKEEGGQVGNPADAAPPGPNDTEMTMLQPGEYVVPIDVVRRKGTDFFDKLKEKAAQQDAEEKEQMAMQNMQAAGIPRTQAIAA